MNNDDYLIKLKDPEVWFEHAFAQKMVADKLLLLQTLFFHKGHTDDSLYGIWEENGVCGGGYLM